MSTEKTKGIDAETWRLMRYYSAESTYTFMSLLVINPFDRLKTIRQAKPVVAQYSVNHSKGSFSALAGIHRIIRYY